MQVPTSGPAWLLAILFVIAASVTLATLFLKTLIEQKAKSLVTQQDAQALTRLVESVKAELATHHQVDTAARQRAYERLVGYLCTPTWGRGPVPAEITADMLVYASDDVARLWLQIAKAAFAQGAPPLRENMSELLMAIRRDAGRPGTDLEVGEFAFLWEARG